MSIKEREQSYREPTPELIKSFKLSVGGLEKVIELRYGNIIFIPSLEEVFQETTKEADLEVFLTLTENENQLPRGERRPHYFFTELVNRRPIIQVQKLVAALYCLSSDSLYVLHGALARPPIPDKKAIAFLGISGAGKGTIISQLCGLSDPKSGQENNQNGQAYWDYLTEEVLLFDRQNNRGFLMGKVRTRCLDFPEKIVVTEPGEVESEGYPIGAFVLLDKGLPGGNYARLRLPVIIPPEMIGHNNVADIIYQLIISRPDLEVNNTPVYRLGTDGNIPATLEAIDKIIE